MLTLPITDVILIGLIILLIIVIVLFHFSLAKGMNNVLSELREMNGYLKLMQHLDDK